MGALSCFGLHTTYAKLPPSTLRRPRVPLHIHVDTSDVAERARAMLQKRFRLGAVENVTDAAPVTAPVRLELRGLPLDHPMAPCMIASSFPCHALSVGVARRLERMSLVTSPRPVAVGASEVDNERTLIVYLTRDVNKDTLEKLCAGLYTALQTELASNSSGSIDVD